MFDTIIDYLDSLSKGLDAGFADDDKNLAIAALFYHMIAADGIVKPVEKVRFDHILEAKFSLTRESLSTLSSRAGAADLRSSGLFPFTSIINNKCSRAEKLEIIEHLQSLAHSDGECHPLEAQLIENVRELLKLPPANPEPSFA